MPHFTFNARIEEAASKPMWRQPVKSARCLIPAIGWYEWKPLEGVDQVTGEIKTAKQPYFLHLNGRMPVAFAGLMSFLHSGTDDPTIMLSAAIITRASEGPAADVHTRMPLMVPKDAEANWLDRQMEDGAKALEIAQKVAVTDVAHHAVSSRVNNSKNTGAALIDPFSNPG